LLVIFGIPIVLLILAVIALCLYHGFLIISGNTTRENIKKRKVDKEVSSKEKFNWTKADPSLFNSR